MIYHHSINQSSLPCEPVEIFLMTFLTDCLRAAHHIPVDIRCCLVPKESSNAVHIVIWWACQCLLSYGRECIRTTTRTAKGKIIQYVLRFWVVFGDTLKSLGAAFSHYALVQYISFYKWGQRLSCTVPLKAHSTPPHLMWGLLIQLGLWLTQQHLTLSPKFKKYCAFSQPFKRTL